MDESVTKRALRIKTSLLRQLNQLVLKSEIESLEAGINEAIELYIRLKEPQEFEQSIQEASSDESYSRRLLETENAYVMCDIEEPKNR
jgi:Tfp pilus assembly protein PilN